MSGLVEVGKGKGDEDNSAKGASARERALRFNRGVIGLSLVTLMAILLLPL